ACAPDRTCATASGPVPGPAHTSARRRFRRTSVVNRWSIVVGRSSLECDAPTLAMKYPPMKNSTSFERLFRPRRIRTVHPEVKMHLRPLSRSPTRVPGLSTTDDELPATAPKLLAP